jgi:hypothetical protein
VKASYDNYSFIGEGQHDFSIAEKAPSMSTSCPRPNLSTILRRRVEAWSHVAILRILLSSIEDNNCIRKTVDWKANMANQTYQPIIVSGINPSTGPDDPDYATAGVVRAHARALELFDPDLVTLLTPVGHNFVQSFAVLPSGSGNQRDPQMSHRQAVIEFTQWLKDADVEYVAVLWSDEENPIVTHSHEDRYEPAPGARTPGVFP